ncbi:MAG: DUF4252 domain-containing protein [Bacteroidaceae bacterium]|nr:DUF4252 domain-containing protein [Bacteroidaceae bacterium]
MKKLFALLVLVFTCQIVFCQTYTDVINQFKDKEGVEFTELSKALLSVALSDADAQSKAVMKNIECMKVLELTESSETIKKDFLAQAAKMESKYNKLVESNENDEINIIFIDGDEDNAKAFIVVSAEGEECQMMVMEGKISLDSLGKIMDIMGGDED